MIEDSKENAEELLQWSHYDLSNQSMCDLYSDRPARNVYLSNVKQLLDFGSAMGLGMLRRYYNVSKSCRQQCNQWTG